MSPSYWPISDHCWKHPDKDREGQTTMLAGGRDLTTRQPSRRPRQDEWRQGFAHPLYRSRRRPDPADHRVGSGHMNDYDTRNDGAPWKQASISFPWSGRGQGKHLLPLRSASWSSAASGGRVIGAGDGVGAEGVTAVKVVVVVVARVTRASWRAAAALVRRSTATACC